MTPEQLRAITTYLRDRVQANETEAPVTITFQTPSNQEMINAGLNPEGVKRLLSMLWWDEMVEDIVETPDMCDPDDPPQQVLEFARDVVTEYISKRFPLNPEEEK